MSSNDDDEKDPLDDEEDTHLISQQRAEDEEYIRYEPDLQPPTSSTPSSPQSDESKLPTPKTRRKRGGSLESLNSDSAELTEERELIGEEENPARITPIDEESPQNSGRCSNCKQKIRNCRCGCAVL